MLLYRCEYLQIISFIDSKIPNFLEKYPGYKIFLLKLHYFNMIVQEKPTEDIYNFLNKEFFPLIKKFNGGIYQDNFDFKLFIENPRMLKSRSYQQIWEGACKTFQEGLSLSIDWILWVENEKNKNSPKVINYYKEKENFVKEINILISFEKEIINNYQSNEFNKLHNYHLNEFEQENNIDIFNKINQEFELNDIYNMPFNNFNFLHNSFGENNEQFLPKNKSLNNKANPFIFENKNDFINNNFYNDINNNLKNNNLNKINYNNFGKNNNINNNSNSNNNDSYSLNTNSIGNKRNSKISNNSKGSNKSYKLDLRKKKIKEFKFKQLKRENVDKKILRKFKKFLKTKSKEKGSNEIKNYLNNNEFWQEYIKQNLMPPFDYEKEKLSFKSFNTQYLCWFFEHKFSLELFNIFTKINYYNLLNSIKEAYNLSEESDDYSLLKNYISTMPLIYGKEGQNRLTSSSSNAKPCDDEINEINENKIKNNNNNQINIQEDKNSDNNINNKYDNMNIENDIIHENENENINHFHINNNINNISNINNTHNDFSNPQTFLYGSGPNINIINNLSENEINNSNLNNSFEDNSNKKNLDQFFI